MSPSIKQTRNKRRFIKFFMIMVPLMLVGMFLHSALLNLRAGDCQKVIKEEAQILNDIR